MQRCLATFYLCLMPKSRDESDFIQLAQLHFGNGFPSGWMLPHIEAFTKEAFEHYEDAAVEGKACFDNWLSKFYEFLSTKLQDVSDGVDTRKMKRIVALARGGYGYSRSRSGGTAFCGQRDIDASFSGKVTVHCLSSLTTGSRSVSCRNARDSAAMSGDIFSRA